MEYILYQYQLSPKVLMERSQSEISEELRKAMKALDEVNEKVRQYEERKSELEEESNSGTGTKALRAKNELAILLTSPLAETLRRLLITAEAAIRTAGGKSSKTESGTVSNRGLVWWLDKDVKTKKLRYEAPKK
uniref:Calcium-regulated actin-bundling protein n=1 Tax=Lygus hesperus TaxID=30085 RepID=A0A0A9YIN7_LYGHE